MKSSAPDGKASSTDDAIAIRPADGGHASNLKLNAVFTGALEKHTRKLKPADQLSFKAAYQDLTPDGILAKVRSFDSEYSKASKLQRCAPTISKCFAILETLMRSTCITLQSNPDVSALVVGAARLVIDVAVKYVTFFPKLTSMLSQLSQYLEVVHRFVERLEAEPDKDAKLVLRCAANIYGDWLDFCKEAHGVFVDKKGNVRQWNSIRIFVRVQWDPFEARFGTIEARFKENLDILLHSTQVLQLSTIQDVLSKIETARLAQIENDVVTTRKDFMHWISLIDFEDDHERISAKKHPGTGDWLIARDDFQAWLQSDSSRLLWCYGKPGSGKSVLASYVLEHITSRTALNPRIGLAFCYFNYKQADTQRPRHILSAFIKQLCWKREVLPPQILAFYRKHIYDARTPSLNALQGALAELCEDFDEIYLVVDALDECEQSLREEILDSVVELSKLHSLVKTFITSRREIDIEQMFKALSTPTICIKAKNTASDIRRYVVDTVDLLTGNKLKVQSPVTKARIVETLVFKADGMFLWVSLQLQSLCRLRTDQDILRQLENLPLDLYETYRRILDIIESLDPTLRALAQRSLTLVFFAARPLLMSELIDLAAVAAGFDLMQRIDMNRYAPTDILEACANLLVEDEGIVRPAHFSIQEYFTSHAMHIQDGAIRKYFFNPAQGHSLVATSCLRYLSFGFLRGGACRTELSLEGRIQRYPCARYTAQYFDYHMTFVEEVSSDLRVRLEIFLSQPERALSSVLQLRRLRKGSYTGILKHEFDNLPWPANAGTVIKATKLHSLTAFRSDSPCWREPPLPATLHQACYDGEYDAVKQLLQHGRNPRTEDGRSLQPIFYAAKGGHPEICRLLLEYNVSSNAGSFSKAIRVAFLIGHEAVVRVLLQHLVQKIDAREIFFSAPEGPCDWLMAAAYGGHEILIRLLIEAIPSLGFLCYGVLDTNDSTFVDFFARTAQAASCHGHLAGLATLLERYPIASLQNCTGTAFHLCCKKGHMALARWLLERGADPNAHSASVQRRMPPDLTLPGLGVETYGAPLDIAAYEDNLELQKLLVRYGADVF